MIFACLAATPSAAIDLSGKWHIRLDPNDVGEREQWFSRVEGTEIGLPGSTMEAKLGTPLNLEPALTKEVFRHLHPLFRYVGAVWHTRTVTLEEGWKDSNATLFLERLIWESMVWGNGQIVGSRDSLSTPHRYSVGQYLQTGKNTLCVRVDNRPKVDTACWVTLTPMKRKRSGTASSAKSNSLESLNQHSPFAHIRCELMFLVPDDSLLALSR